jgi:two-component system chemotaxis response regulator CheB
MRDKIKVLVVDDTLTIRMFLKALLSKCHDIEVVGAAPDPISAQPLISLHQPDVITLDVEMPKMDGLTFLEKLMRLRPTPVVMFSTLTHKGSEAAMRALSLGAVEVIGKPTGDHTALQEIGEDIVCAVRAAAAAKVGGKPARHSATIHAALETNNYNLDTVLPRTTTARTSNQPLIVMGSSTGGTEVLRQILPQLHTHMAPIVVVQHMPEGFTTALADRLSKLGTIPVQEATHGMPLLPGHAYIAPGGKQHLAVEATSQGYRAQLLPLDRVNRHRPSVDVLFRSAAQCARGPVVGIILTGMGNDGAQGLKELHELGATTIAQDEASCVVYGMPRAAAELKAATHYMTPQQIVHFLNKHTGVKHG